MIAFGIPNLPPMHIVGIITRGSVKSKTNSSARILVAVMIAGMIVGIVVVFAIFFVLRKRNNRRNYGDLESTEMSKVLPESKHKLTVVEFHYPFEKHKKIPHLEGYIVPNEKLICAEYCFNIPLDVAKSPKDDPSVTHLQQILTALLNTSGGIIELENEGNRTGDCISMVEYIRNIEKVLFEVIPEVVYNECVKIYDVEFPLRMLVKKSRKLITFNSHMYIRQSGRNTLLRDTGAIQSVMSQPTETPPLDPFDGIESFEYGFLLSFLDGIECVCILPDHLDNTSFLNASSEKSLLALSNISSGGYLIVGMDSSVTVLGVRLQQQGHDLSESVGNFLQRDDLGNPRIWEKEGRVPQEGEDWTIKLIPVTGGPTEDPRWLVVIHMYHCQGGVWTKCPESFMISEGGCVYGVTFNSWNNIIGRTPAVAEVATRRAEYGTGEQYSDQPIAMETPIGTISEASCSDTCSTKSSGLVMGQSGRKTDDSSIDEILKSKGYVSFMEHSFPGKVNLKGATTDLLTNACKFANESHIFTPDKPMTVTPAKDIIISRHVDQKKEITAAIEHIEAYEGSETRSFCLVTSNWTRDARHQGEVERPPGHLLDVFVVDTNGHIKLWAIANKIVQIHTDNRTLIYTRVSGRKTKRALLLNQPYFSSSASEYIPSIWIECHVIEIKNIKTFIEAQDSTLPRYFNITNDHIEGIKISLSMLMLNTITTITSVYGEELSYTLTSEQLDIIRNIGLSKFTSVEGPPGSGKTRLALYICKNYSNCGYICTTETFKRYLIYQGLPEQSIFYTEIEGEIERQIKKGDFTSFEYLIYDDAHNSSFSERVCKKMCKYVSRSDKTKLVVFGDSRYQNFMETDQRSTISNYIQQFCQRSKHDRLLELNLSEIHRNTKNVTSFISSNFGDDADIACSNIDEGGDVVVKLLSNIWSTETINDLVSYVEDLVGPGEMVHNEPTDVVILVDIVDEKEHSKKNPVKLRELLLHSLGENIDVHDAGTFPVTGLTIDTLNNFMGFDRKVCILVSDEQIQTTPQQTGHSFDNPKYKAFVASRGTSKVVFVVEKELTSSQASKFHCDNITVSEPRRLWSKPLGVNDVCWLRMDQTAALLYTSDSVVSLVSLEGENLDLTIDTSGIKGRCCVACSTSGQTIVVTDGDTPYSWTVYHRQDSRRYDRKATYDIDGEPMSVKLTSDGDVLMLVDEILHGYLRRYRAADGRLLWETSVGDVSGGLAVDSADRVYVGAERAVAVYSPGGEHIQTIRAPRDLPDITAICADSSGRRLFTGHDDGSVSLFRDQELVRSMIETGRSHVWSLCLYRDTYLGINGSGKLYLFNVKSVM